MGAPLIASASWVKYLEVSEGQIVSDLSTQQVALPRLAMPIKDSLIAATTKTSDFLRIDSLQGKMLSYSP